MVQQSRARGKTEFMLAFEPIVADAMALAYKSASQEVQGKLKRVVEVWRQRSIFDKAIQESVEKRIGELDKARGSRGMGGGGAGSGGRLGGSLFGGAGAVPSELEGVSQSQAALSQAGTGVKPVVDTANAEYAKLTDPAANLPTPPVHAARLSALMKNLATAQGAVEASINARKQLLAGLEKLVESNRAKLAEEETTATDLASRRDGVEMKKKEVEDGIMRGLSAPSSPDIPTPTSATLSNGTFAPTSNGAEVARPEAEDFTPPPPDVESFTPTPPAQQQETEMTPIGDPIPLLSEESAFEQAFASTTGAEAIHELPPNFNEPPPTYEPPPVLQTRESSSVDAAAQANEFLNSLNVVGGGAGGQIRQASSELPAAAANGDQPGDPRLKRRKMSHPKPSRNKDVDEDIFGVGNVGGVDEDGISALLRQ